MRKLLQALRRLLGGKVTGGGGRPGSEDGGSAGVREPRRPLPPDTHLGATRHPDPDPQTVNLPDPRQ